MKKIFITLLLATLTLSAVEHKVVFDVRTDSEKTIEQQVINNISFIKEHYAKTGDTLKAVVVLSGGTYSFFKKSTADKTIANELSKLATIEVCSMGLKKRHIAKTDMLPFVIPAVNRTEALIRYQNEGYAYIFVK